MFVSEAFRVDEPAAGVLRPAVISMAFDRIQLAEQLHLAIGALPVVSDGHDELVSRIAEDFGIGLRDAIILRLRSRQRSFTLVLALSGVWDLKKPALCALKRSAFVVRRRVLLVSAGWLRRPDFINNCAMLSSSVTAAASATDKMMILDYVAQDPGATLRDCAERVSNALDPFGVVLSLVAEGLLRLDLGRRITPDVKVSPGRHDHLTH